MKLDKELFKSNIGGKETCLHFLKNKNNMQVAITNYGARIVSIFVNDKNGNSTDVVVGFDSIYGYLNSTETYHGAIVGRYANRIANGKFSLNKKDYQLAINNAPNHLHGGPNGFHNQVWKLEEASDKVIKLSLFSKDGEENYPGNLRVDVSYVLSDDNELNIFYEARTDQTTIINLTAHPFFNLNGQGSGTILDHTLQINAEHYNPVDDELIPTGIETVENTPFNFRKEKKIGKNIDKENNQLKYGFGYDHNFVLDGEGFRSVAKAIGNESQIAMEVLTDQPGMQLYSGNYMNSENKIKYGFMDDFRTSFCLETQHFPDSPNHLNFPSTVLEPGNVFKSRTVYKFSIEG